jgi:tetratricopeptide (TPR) repeat protein
MNWAGRFPSQPRTRFETTEPTRWILPRLLGFFVTFQSSLFLAAANYLSGRIGEILCNCCDRHVDPPPPGGEGRSEGERSSSNTVYSIDPMFQVAAMLCLFVIFQSPRVSAATNDWNASFDAANRLFEQRKYPEAAAAYEKLISAGARSETIYFNLGNALFKAGQVGQGIAAWRAAERMNPRDPSIRFNLQFARKQVTGRETPAGPAWQRALQVLTLNEWTVLATIALWLWFGLLALREWRPALRRTLSGYTATVGTVFLLVGVGLGAAANLQFGTHPAVVITADALVRQSPLEDSKVMHQFRDGTELTVLDRKDFADGAAKQVWLQVREAAGRSGWMRSENVVLINAPALELKP